MAFKHVVATLMLVMAPWLAHARTVAGVADIQGEKPRYLQQVSMDFDNAAAVQQALFVPALDDGFIPQGLAQRKGAFYVSGYVQARDGQRPECRIYRLLKDKPRERILLPLPASCNHAGGLAMTDGGVLLISDNIRLFTLLVSDGGKPLKRAAREIRLQAPLKGTFVSYHRGMVYLGSYMKDLDVTRVHVFPQSVLSKAEISVKDAVDSFDAPHKSQGAYFDDSDYAWTTSQAKGFNYLNKFNMKTRKTEQRYRLVRGMQGIVKDADGSLWVVSEAGALKYRDWSQRFPAIFRLDVKRLQAE
ncbi:MAG TPA: hypothetical protein VFX11_07125 [Candidatus Kapabacteria bacterium]|nr:hypothetical protein [Candidatus Kapabacteria bacterium]